MTIREVSEKYNISQATLRYYEKVGIIPKVDRTQGGIRNYCEKDMKWLELVLCMRSSGLSVAAMSEFIRLSQEGEHTVPKRAALLKQQKMELIEKRKEIDDALNQLNVVYNKFL